MFNMLPGDITYRRLEQTLTKLGFTRTDGDTFTAFSNEKHNAFIVLPHTSPEERVSEQHLIAVKQTLEGKGVASFTQFYEVLKHDGTSKRPGITRPQVRASREEEGRTINRSSNSAHPSQSERLSERKRRRS